MTSASVARFERPGSGRHAAGRGGAPAVQRVLVGARMHCCASVRRGPVDAGRERVQPGTERGIERGSPGDTTEHVITEGRRVAPSNLRAPAVDNATQCLVSYLVRSTP